MPRFLYQQIKTGSGVVGWNDNVKKMIPAEQTIRDVCSTCNNGPLSQLDDYGKTVLGDAHILDANFVARTAQLIYDYDMLLRWLLKISFNSARRTGAQSAMLEPFAPYILAGHPCPHKAQIALFVELLRPEILDEEKRALMHPSVLSDERGRCNPFLVRIAWATNMQGGFERYRLRVNIFGALAFFIMLPKPDLKPGQVAVAKREFLKSRPGSKEVQRRRRHVTVECGAETWLDAYGPQIMRARMHADV